jgi:hypothetical protein
VKHEPRNFFELAVAKLGPVKGARVVMFVGMWSLAMHKAGDRWDLMTETQRVEAYADAEIISLATAWRRLALYRKVTSTDPTALIRAAQLEVENRRQAKDVFGVGLAVPLP